MEGGGGIECSILAVEVAGGGGGGGGQKDIEWMLFIRRISG